MEETKITKLMTGLISRYPALKDCRDSILTAYLLLKETFLNGRKFLICGNGGSAADAEHICGELMKGFLKRRPIPHEIKQKLFSVSPDNEEWIGRLQMGLPVISLTANSPLASAIMNDLGADLVFAQQVLSYGKDGDTLMAISTSGNSPNIIKAATIGKIKNLNIIGLTGYGGGLLNPFCNVVIAVPGNHTYEIQEYHLPVYHCICAMLEEYFFS